MKALPVISLVLSIILGLVAFAISQGWLFAGSQQGGATAASQASPAPVATTRILVARGDIALGEQVTAERIGFTDWPAERVPSGALTSKAAFAFDTDQAPFASGFIADGEPLLPPKLLEAPPRQTLSKMIPEGLRAVTIEVSLETGVAGFVLPGDRVDITAFDRVPGEVGPDSVRPVPMIENVKVLAVDQTYGRQQEGAIPSRFVTLALTPEDGRKVAAASRDAKLALALIGEDEAKAAEVTKPRVMSVVRAEPAQAPRPPSPARELRPGRVQSTPPPRPGPENVRIEVVHGEASETVTAPVQHVRQAEVAP